MIYRLNVEDLSVESFEPTTTSQYLTVDPLHQNLGIDWTGCDSACTECGVVQNHE